LLAPVVQALRGLSRHIHKDEVFLGERGGVLFPQEAWTRALKEAKISEFRFHDLTHTFASYLAMSGATLAELAEALGHKTLAMVKRYAHLSEAHTSAVVRRMGGKFLA
jgi:integrase